MKSLFLFTFLTSCLQVFPASSAREYLFPAPDTVAFPAGCESREITIAVNDTLCLAGTLTVPADGQASHPAVVIISGTGQQDRDAKFDEYVTLEEDIAPEVLRLIGEWLEERFK